jgi:Fic family protein
MDKLTFESSPIGDLVPISGVNALLQENYEHWAYVPRNLPVEIELGNQTHALVAEAARQLGNLQGLLGNVPNPQLLIRSSVKREAQSTSALEGTYATLEAIFEGELLPEDSLPGDLREVINYINAAHEGLKIAESGAISINDLSRLQNVIVYKTEGGRNRPGQIRDRQVIIGDPTRPISESRFIPPPAGDSLRNSYYEWEKWIHSNPHMHSIIVIALAHYQFETIHPYFDGNGRLGRLIILMQLQKEGLLVPPVLNLSGWFNQQPDEYRDQLRKLSATGNWAEWIEFFCAAVIGQSKLEVKRINELLEFRSNLLSKLRDSKNRGFVIQLAETLIGNPFFTVSGAAKEFGVAFPTVNNAVKKLVGIGVIRELTGKGYERIFMTPGVMKILES